MPSFTGKTFSSYFKNLLGINQASNTGVDATTRTVQDGAGNNTALHLSDSRVKVSAARGQSTTTLSVINGSDENILTVDTTNSKVLAGASQVAVNTQYAHFGVANGKDIAASTGTHYAIPFGNMGDGFTNLTLGTGTDPATSYDVSATDNGDDLTVMLWYIIDDITVDAVHWFAGGDAASGDTINVHLMSYDIDKSGSGSGDLSGGVVIAGGADIASLGYEDVIYQTIAPSTADVDAGKVCIFTFESAGTNSDYSINATVKYHIR